MLPLTSPGQTVSTLVDNVDCQPRKGHDTGQTNTITNALVFKAIIGTTSAIRSMVVNPVYRRQQPYDTYAPPNILATLLSIATTPIVVPPVSTDQVAHRDSMKGQADVPPNTILTLSGGLIIPQFIFTSLYDGNQTYRSRSYNGQTDTIQNNLISTLSLIPQSQIASIVVNPVYGHKNFQPPDLVPNNIILQALAVAPPFITNPFLFDQPQKRDSISGQRGGGGFYVLAQFPIVGQSYPDQPYKAHPTQEPFIYPNVIIRGIVATAPPFVQSYFPEGPYKNHTAQDPFLLPNVLAITKPIAVLFAQQTYPDNQLRAHPTQTPYDLPNATWLGLPPAAPTPAFIPILYPDQAYRAHPTQTPYDLPNATFLLPPIPQTFMPLQTSISIAVNAGFVINPYIAVAYSNVVPFGYTISQSPAAGTIVPWGTVLMSFTMSLGPAPPQVTIVSVPNVVGLTTNDAIKGIAAGELINANNFVWAYSSSTPQGYIMATSPPAGALVTPGTIITLTASLGPPPNYPTLTSLVVPLAH